MPDKLESFLESLHTTHNEHAADSSEWKKLCALELGRPLTLDEEIQCERQFTAMDDAFFERIEDLPPDIGLSYWTKS